jgi:hypothetical protein
LIRLAILPSIRVMAIHFNFALARFLRVETVFGGLGNNGTCSVMICPSTGVMRLIGLWMPNVTVFLLAHNRVLAPSLSSRVLMDIGHLERLGMSLLSPRLTLMAVPSVSPIRTMAI